MRIIHGIYGKCQSSGNGKHYLSPKAKKFPGFRIELLTCDTDPFHAEGDAIEIEGDGDAVIAMLQDLLSVAKTTRDFAIEDWEKERGAKMAR